MDIVWLLCEVHLLHSFQVALATFAMTSSHLASFAEESEMIKTAIAICCPFGILTSPTSLVAAVTSLTVRDVPVLCAITVPLGNSPLMRFRPVGVSAIYCSNKA